MWSWVHKPPLNPSRMTVIHPTDPEPSPANPPSELLSMLREEEARSAKFRETLADAMNREARRNEQFQQRILALLSPGHTPGAGNNDGVDSDDSFGPPLTANNLDIHAITSSSSSHLRSMKAQIPTSAPDGSMQVQITDLPTVKPLNSAVRLDQTGEFINTPVRRSSFVSHSSIKSFAMEDAVMDAREQVSYVEISAREKQDIFRLPAVRRSMRHLDFAEMLMCEETMNLSTRYERVVHQRGDARATCERVVHQRGDARAYLIYSRSPCTPIKTRRSKHADQNTLPPPVHTCVWHTSL